jgi:hypothetical protein
MYLASTLQMSFYTSPNSKVQHIAGQILRKLKFYG